MTHDGTTGEMSRPSTKLDVFKVGMQLHTPANTGKIPKEIRKPIPENRNCPSVAHLIFLKITIIKAVVAVPAIDEITASLKFEKRVIPNNPRENWRPITYLISNLGLLMDSIMYSVILILSISPKLPTQRRWLSGRRTS